MRHVSDPINADLGKLSDGKAAEIRRVASSDTNSTTPRGANRPTPFADQARKVSAHRTLAQPNSVAAPTGGSPRPPANWPTNSEKFSSGLAKRGAIGSLPSKTAPSR